MHTYRLKRFNDLYRNQATLSWAVHQITSNNLLMVRALAKLSSMMEKIAIRLEKIGSGESPGFNKTMESVVHRVTNANSYFEPIDNTKLKRNFLKSSLQLTFLNLKN